MKIAGLFLFVYSLEFNFLQRCKARLLGNFLLHCVKK